MKTNSNTSHVHSATQSTPFPPFPTSATTTVNRRTGAHVSFFSSPSLFPPTSSPYNKLSPYSLRTAVPVLLYNAYHKQHPAPTITMSRILLTQLQNSIDGQLQQDEEIQRRMTFNHNATNKKERPSAQRIFQGTVTGVAIIETMDDVDEEDRPSFDLSLLDACLIPVQPVAAADITPESPLTRIDGCEPTFASTAKGSVGRDDKKTKCSPKQKAKLQAARLEHMREDGYIIFDDAFLRMHPDSRVARLAGQYANAYPLDAPPARVTKSGKSKRCKRAAYFVSAAEKEHRPCFRRCPSEVFYGRAQYTDAMEPTTPLTSSFLLKPAENDSMSGSASKSKSKPSVLKRILKNFSSNSLDPNGSFGPSGATSGEDSDSGVHNEVNIPPRVASVSIQG